MAWQDAPSGWAPVGDYTGLGGGGGGPGVFPSSPGGFGAFSGGGGSPWLSALNLASGFLGGGSSKSGGSSNVDTGGYLQQAKKQVAQEKKQQGAQRIFDNFYKEWDPVSDPQQFLQNYSGVMSGGGGGGSSSSGGSRVNKVLSGAAAGASAGSFFPGAGTLIGAGIGALGGLFS